MKMKKKNNSGLLDRKRFKSLREEEIEYLQNLSVRKSIRIMESLLDSGIMNEYKNIHKSILP